MKFLIGILISFSIFTTACPLSEHHNLEKRLEDRINKFHEQLNEGKFSDIYTEANEGLKKSQTESEFAEKLNLVKNKTGEIKPSSLVTLESDYKRYVRFAVNKNEEKIEYRNFLTCENGIGFEKFVFYVNNEKVEIISYELEKVAKQIKIVGKDGTEYVLGNKE